MRKRYLSLFIFLFFGIGNARIQAQNTFPTDVVSSASDNLTTFPFADRSVFFSVSDSGVYKPITFGLDLAWLDENNVRRGIAFMGKERVKIIRSSFMPTNPLVGDTALQGDALKGINKRLDIINKYMGAGTKIMLNDDNPTVHAVFYKNPKNWTKLMEVTGKYHEKRGFNVVSVAPFNEPDNTGAGQGTVQDFYNINVEVKKNPYFNGKRLSGPNMLNTDVFFNWYNPMKDILDEGNTHQLAGSFDNYALIFQTVRANGQMATNDEMHNVMEAMVGVEYGLQTGIWWGTAELARGEFCKASDGVRLGYAEHRPNWTSASVYRHPNGKIQAFGGASERQSVTTTYRFVSKERDVYYDGHGPQREFVLELPGGLPNTYGTPLHCSPERVINITWGDDIQPVINGRYKLVNRKSGKIMESASGNIRQNTYTGATLQQWNVTPIDSRIGGDFSYYKIANVNDGLCPDVLNFSLENGANIIPYTLMTVNQQWYLEYAEDGWFYIRSKHSNKCIEVANGNTAAGANIQQWEKNGGINQQWRFLPVAAPIEFVAPGVPVNLVATANSESVRLDWSANPENDIAGYTIFRSDSEGGSYHTIARNVTSNSFVDNTCTIEGQYFYKIKTVDKSLNSSAFSEKVVATTTGSQDLVAHFMFNGNTLDSSINLNHGATPDEITFAKGKVDSQAIMFNGDDTFIQLPATLTNQPEITVAIWVYWNGGTPWQRIFDFGNGENEYMNLTPRMRFAIKNGSGEQRLDGSALPVGEWVHVAVTLGASGARLYKNGKLVDESTEVTIRPIDFKPVLNYIGKAQTDVPLFDGLMDDFKIYNYEMPAEEIAVLASDVNTGTQSVADGSEIKIKVYPVPADNVLKYSIDTHNIGCTETLSLYNMGGKLVLQKDLKCKNEGEINVSDIPSGIYMLKISGTNMMSTGIIVINHE